MRGCFQALDNGLYVLCLAEFGLRDHLTLAELRCVMSRKQAKAESKVAEIKRLKEPV